MRPQKNSGSSTPHEASLLLQHEEAEDNDRKVCAQLSEAYEISQVQLIELSKEDDSDPRSWSKWKKLSNIAVIASMSSKSHTRCVSAYSD
jgi:hypothetical protein